MAKRRENTRRADYSLGRFFRHPGVLIPLIVIASLALLALIVHLVPDGSPPTGKLSVAGESKEEPAPTQPAPNVPTFPEEKPLLNNKTLMVNCIENDYLKAPYVKTTNRGRVYFVYLDLIELPPSYESKQKEMADRIEKETEGTANFDDTMVIAARIQSETIPISNYTVHSFVGGPYDFNEYQMLIGSIWSMMVELKYGRVFQKFRDGRWMLYSMHGDALIDAQYTFPRWNINKQTELRNRFTGKVEKGFNLIQQNAGEDSIAEVQRRNEEQLKRLNRKR